MVRNISRFLSILVVLFFGIFIIEGFNPDFNLADSVSHLVLTLIVLAIAISSWKWPKIGGCFFIGLGILFAFFFTPFIWAGLLIGGTVLITGVLFVLEGFKILK